MRDRVVGYIRVSEQESKSDRNPAGEQIDVIADWAAQNEADVLQWFFDIGVSETEPFDRRPAGTQLLSRVRRGDVTHVVVSSLDVLGNGRALLDAVQSLFGVRQGLRVITALPGPHEDAEPADAAEFDWAREARRRSLKAA